MGVASEQWPVGALLSGRRSVTTRVGDVIELPNGQHARVETAKAADDLRDAKCTFTVMGFCDRFIDVPDDPWAGTYCKLRAGHRGDCSPHYMPTAGEGH